MDENNLDSLLDELSSMDGELNENIDIDSGVDVDADDMDDISLDELDHLDGMDLGDLDFDDIDFDDVDITKLDAGANPVVKKKPQEQETDDMSLDALIEKANQENVKPEPPQEEPSVQADNTDVFGEADLQMQEDTALPEGVFDDALFGSMDMGMSEEPELSEKEKNPYTADEDSLDALLQSSMAESLLNGDLADIEDIGEKTEEPVKKVKQPRKKAEKKKAEIEEEETEHKKKTISGILFGEPDEDDLEEEALFEEKKAKKEAEKKKKQAEREAKKEEKDDEFLSRFVYPLIGFVTVAAFLGVLFTRKEFDVELALKSSIRTLVAAFGGFYLASYLLNELWQGLFKREKDMKLCQRFVGYSSSLMFALNIVLMLLPEFFFLRIFVLYTFYIVWEGAGPYMQVEEKIRLKFVGIATGLILLTPWLIEVILSMLMPGLRF